SHVEPLDEHPPVSLVKNDWTFASGPNPATIQSRFRCNRFTPAKTVSRHKQRLVDAATAIAGGAARPNTSSSAAHVGRCRAVAADRMRQRCQSTSGAFRLA